MYIGNFSFNMEKILSMLMNCNLIQHEMYYILLYFSIEMVAIKKTFFISDIFDFDYFGSYKMVNTNS